MTTIIPVYNGERYLPATLDSLARQTIRPDRVIIQDNCSTDGTRQVVEAFRDRGFEWRKNESNLGHTANLNRALELSSETEYLHILLADDLIKPAFYERLLPALAPFEGQAIGYCPFEIIDETGRVTSSPRGPWGGQPRLIPLQRFLAAQAELQTILIPAVVLKTAGRPSPARLPVDLPQVGDCVFYARWGKECQRIIEVPEILCQYRRHSASGTDRHLLNLQVWVLDEWKVMQTVSALMGDTGMASWLRRQRLRCIFAARSQVKVQMMRRQHPEYARGIRDATQALIGPLHWTLGRCAVGLRDFSQLLRGG
ncbi:MAG: glycosyltransferase family 2 protein [Candidatus Omnitrophica bacterium]|nr:glycosyltransferase family 2 protein [Candidatus Omnitrophota bacterium]